MPSPQDYARWVYDRTRNWGMWLPYESVDLGDVGHFTKDKIFEATDFTAEELINVQPVHGPSHGMTDCIIGRTKDFRISGFGEAEIAQVGSKLSISLEKEQGFLIYIAKGYTHKLRNVNTVLSKMRDGVLAGDWRLDYALVGKRLVATEGFAAIFSGTNASLNFTTKAPLSVNQSVPAAIGAGFGFQGSSGAVELFTFGGESTPTLGCAWRVRRDLRDKLLGGRATAAAKQDWVFADNKARIKENEILSHGPAWLFEKSYTFEDLP